MTIDDDDDVQVKKTVRSSSYEKKYWQTANWTYREQTQLQCHGGGHSQAVTHFHLPISFRRMTPVALNGLSFRGSPSPFSGSCCPAAV